MPEQTRQPLLPRTVRSAKFVKMAVVEYADPDGTERAQFAVVGDNTLVLVNGNPLGITNNRNEPAGVASKWLRDAVFKALGLEVPKD